MAVPAVVPLVSVSPAIADGGASVAPQTTTPGTAGSSTGPSVPPPTPTVPETPYDPVPVQRTDLPSPAKVTPGKVATRATASTTSPYSAQGQATLSGVGPIWAVIPGDLTDWQTGIITQTAYFTGNAWVQTGGDLVTIKHVDQLTCSGVDLNVSVSLGGVELAAGFKSATGSREATVSNQWNHVWEYNGSGQWKCKVTAYLPAKATRRTSGTLSTKSTSSTVAASYEWWFCC